jgi:hypothetical protein
MVLKALDDAVFEPRLPPAIFYNLLVSARVPAVKVGKVASRNGAQPAMAAR